MYMSDTKFELFLCGIMILVGIGIGFIIDTAFTPSTYTIKEYQWCLKNANEGYCKLHYKDAASYMEKNGFVFKVK